MKNVIVKGIESMEHNGNLHGLSSHFELKASGFDLSVSDGYHTMDELYDHRIKLFIALCRKVQDFKYHGDPRNTFGDEKIVWRSTLHADGTMYYDQFILGINREKGKQITYHLPMVQWSFCDFAETLEKAPQFDGHTSNDVLARLKQL